MSDFNEILDYDCFYAALIFFIDKEEYGGQTRIAIDSQTSDGYLSQLKSKKRNASFKKQVKIAKTFGYTYRAFLDFGRDLLEKNNPTPPPKTITKPDPPELAAAIDDLRAIYESKDPMLIGAIKSNLVEFRRAADDRKKHDEKIRQMEKNIEQLQQQMKQNGHGKADNNKRPPGIRPAYERRAESDRRKSKNG